jgi:hypothetical protein
MILDCVLTAVNENQLYLDFVPYFIKSWRKLYPNIAVKIILIATRIPENLQMYSDSIILFTPLEHMSTSFISQFIRILYPCILSQYKNGILITDIDMIPMNTAYFSENIAEISDDKFIYYGIDFPFHNERQIPICYTVALSHTWRDVLRINDINGIIQVLRETYQSTNYINGLYSGSWFTDQLVLYKRVMEWNAITNNFIIIPNSTTNFTRLDRIDNFGLSDSLCNSISDGVYDDYHCLRPMEQHKHINESIFKLLSLP